MTEQKNRRFIGASVAATCVGLAMLLRTASACAVPLAWTDARVSQNTVTSTICHRGHMTQVMPSIDEQIRLKEALLEQRGINPEASVAYALDFRMPVLLGGSPAARENLDVLPWEGENGERRKRRFAVFLRHCVCSGELSLMRAQNAISGNWANDYPNLWALTCKDVR